MSVVTSPLTSSVPVGAPAPYLPGNDPIALEIYLDGMRKMRLKEEYGWGSGLPKLPREGCPPERLAHADALRALASTAENEPDRRSLEKRAQRLEMCGRLGELFECPECIRAFKQGWNCYLRSCPLCGKRIFDRAFAELLPLDSYVPAALASLPGWGWKILDYTFHHDGNFPTRNVMRKMRVVVNRATDRAVREKCRDMYRAGFGCKQRFNPDDGLPMMFEGWPVVSAPDGSARVLEGWTVVRVGRVGKRPTCTHCGSRVKKVRGENARICPKCGPREWPDWDNQERDNRRWRLRFGVLHIPVSEFGFDGTNYHFHTCYFGPFLPNNPSCVQCGSVVRRNSEVERSWNCPNCGAISKLVDGRLTQIFREESKKLLGIESRGVWIEPAKRGYRSVLAHALKYTAKMPGSTPQRLAEYERVLVGVRRYAVRGFLQGVALEDQKRGAPKCPNCKTPLKRITGLGLVPLSEVEDIPFLPEEERAPLKKDNEFCFYEAEEMAGRAPRAPC
jgi:predicted  nucleic acid-binding Zn-ribbon protein